MSSKPTVAKLDYKVGLIKEAVGKHSLQIQDLQSDVSAIAGDVAVLAEAHNNAKKSQVNPPVGMQSFMNDMIAWQELATKALNKHEEALATILKAGPGAMITGTIEEMHGHASDCAVHNLPAMPAGECDCGFDEIEVEMKPEPVKKTAPLLYCSFCGKSQKEVKKLIAGPSAHICNECGELVVAIVADDDKKQALKKAVAHLPPHPLPDSEFVTWYDKFKELFVAEGMDPETDWPSDEVMTKWVDKGTTPEQAFELLKEVVAEVQANLKSQVPLIPVDWGSYYSQVQSFAKAAGVSNFKDIDDELKKLHEGKVPTDLVGEVLAKHNSKSPPFHMLLGWYQGMVAEYSKVHHQQVPVASNLVHATLFCANMAPNACFALILDLHLSAPAKKTGDALLEKWLADHSLQDPDTEAYLLFVPAHSNVDLTQMTFVQTKQAKMPVKVVKTMCYEHAVSGSNTMLKSYVTKP